MDDLEKANEEINRLLGMLRREREISRKTAEAFQAMHEEDRSVISELKRRLGEDSHGL